MNDTVEKSCWNITLWAVVAVVGIAFVALALSGTNQKVSEADMVKSVSKVASN